MITSEVKFTQIEDRIDAGYYKLEYFELDKKLKKIKTKKIKELISEIKYGTSEDLTYFSSGVPLLRVTDVNDFFDIDIETVKFISKEDATRLKDYQVQKGDILISRTGTLGLAVYINNRLTNSVYGSYFIKIKLADKRFNPKFVASFINSRLGNLQTQRLASGGIQTNLTIDAIKSIQVPIIPRSTQQKIVDLVHRSHKARKKAKEFLKEAKRKVEEMIEKGVKN